MADVRVAPNVVLSDGTTLSQLAAVDAAGRLSVSLTASSATVTVDTELPAAAALADNAANPTAPAVVAFLMLWDGSTWDRGKGDSTDGALVNLGANNDVTVTSGSITADTELPAAAALADAAANPTTPTVGAGGLTYNGTTWDRRRSVVAAQDTTGTGIAAAGILGQFDDASTATVTENQFAPVRISTRRALLIEGVASGTVVPVSLTSTTITGTVTVDSELPAAAALADATANPTVPAVGSFLMGYNGTTWDRVRTANTGRLQVDVISGGGAETPTNPVNNYDTTSAVAAGATDNHDTADLGGTTKKASAIIMGASVPMKGELQEIENGAVISTLGVFFTRAGETNTFRPPHRNYWSTAFSANAGFDGFRLARTNLDPSEAADVYSEIMYED